MDNILTDFGVQPVYLAAQAVNFIILLWVLKKFLYKPVLKVLEDRKNTVFNSVRNAEQITAKLKITELESAEKLSKVSKQAQTILKKASTTADQIITDAHEKAHVDVELLIEKGKQSISAERDIMKIEMRQELAGLVLIAVEKIAGKVVDQSDHIKIVDQAIENLKSDIPN